MMRHLDWMTDKIKENLMVSNSLPFILQSRYQAHFGKAHFWKNMLYVAFVFCCLISTTQSQRYWEIKRENGNLETCCFCLHQDLRNREHIIKECEVKFGRVNILGYTGPPICSCLSSKKYPRCPDIHNICGKNIDCPNNKVYESCNIKKLLTLKTMTCNDSLQWEHDIDCNATCMPSNNIKNGIARCHILGNKVVCNCTCKEGFLTSQTKNLSCIEAKNTICNPVKTKLYLLEILLPIGIFIIIIISSSIIIIIYWKKYCCFGDVRNGDVPNDIPNGDVRNGDVPNGHVQNGILRNGYIAQESNHTQNDGELNHIPGAQESNQMQIAEESNLPTGAQMSNHTPGDGESNHTPGAEEFNETQIAEESSLPTSAQMSNHTPGDGESNHTPGAEEFNETQIAEESSLPTSAQMSNHTPGDQETNHTTGDGELNHIPGAQESNQTQKDEEPSLPTGDVESLPYEVGYLCMGFPECPESLQDVVQEEIEMEPLLSKHESEIRLSQEETGRPNFQE